MLLHNQFEKRVRFQRKHLDLKDRKESFNIGRKQSRLGFLKITNFNFRGINFR